MVLTKSMQNQKAWQKPWAGTAGDLKDRWGGGKEEEEGNSSWKTHLGRVYHQGKRHTRAHPGPRLASQNCFLPVEDRKSCP